MRALFLSLLLALGACSSTEVQEYKGNEPTLILEDFFQGTLTAHGVLKNRSGKVTRYFNATIEASWDDNGVGRLAERFEFNDGEIQHRNWRLEPTGEGRYRATAGDVIGPGYALVSGNAMKMNYVLEVDYKDRKLELSVEDWMWRVDKNTVINQSVLRKWGFKVGTIQLTILRQGD